MFFKKQNGSLLSWNNFLKMGDFFVIEFLNSYPHPFWAGTQSSATFPQSAVCLHQPPCLIKPCNSSDDPAWTIKIWSQPNKRTDKFRDMNEVKEWFIVSNNNWLLWPQWQQYAKSSWHLVIVLGLSLFFKMNTKHYFWKVLLHAVTFISL